MHAFEYDDINHAHRNKHARDDVGYSVALKNGTLAHAVPGTHEAQIAAQWLSDHPEHDPAAAAA